MNKIIGWLESMFTRRANSTVDDSPDDNTIDVPSEAEVADQEDVPTLPDLVDLDVDSSDTDKQTGIDPYDTAHLHKK